MASDDKKIKTNSAPKNEAAVENKSTSGASPSKAEGDNWNVIFGKKKKR